MRKIEAVVEGLKILITYPGAEINPGHDQIWAGPDAEDVKKEDAAKLESLKWFIDDETNSWAIFT